MLLAEEAHVEQQTATSNWLVSQTRLTFFFFFFFFFQYAYDWLWMNQLTQYLKREMIGLYSVFFDITYAIFGLTWHAVDSRCLIQFMIE